MMWAQSLGCWRVATIDLANLEVRGECRNAIAGRFNALAAQAARQRGSVID